MSTTEEVTIPESAKNSSESRTGLREIKISAFRNSVGTQQDIVLSYQLFGQKPGNAPVVLVTHTLTGNSGVTGEQGWWKSLVGSGCAIDTKNFTVLCIDMPGNGYTGNPEHLIDNYGEFTLKDVARIFAEVLEVLEIKSLFAAVGGSIGGALIWELAALCPDLIQRLIPIATDCKTTDWVRAQCHVQQQILDNSKDPVYDARIHAMTLYRTPESFRTKFNGDWRETAGEYQVCNWLSFHGKNLKERFQLASYKLMNHLLTTINIGRDSGDCITAASKIKASIHIVAIDSDQFFVARENQETYSALSLLKKDVHFHQIQSVHGHDAFLMEHRQLTAVLTPIFNTVNQTE